MTPSDRAAFLRYASQDAKAARNICDALGSRMLTPPNLAQTLNYGSASSLSMTRLVVEWASVVGVLLLAGFALKLSDWYSRSVLLTWFAATPVALIGVQEGQVRVARWLNERGALSVRYVIVGLNKVGRELAERLPKQGFFGIFDFRSPKRLAESYPGVAVAGDCRALADFVRESAVNAVYIALPIGNAPRSTPDRIPLRRRPWPIDTHA